MAFCSNCGGKVDDGVKFCPGCGNAVGGVKNESGISVPQQQATVVQAQSILADEKFCFSCGSVVKSAAVTCPKCGVNQNNRNAVTAIDVYCTSCGKTIKKIAETCPFCGVKQGQNGSNKNWSTLLILSILLGVIGVDRFYAGHVGLGILKLLTWGGMGIWYIIDIILVATGKFKDKNGNVIKN